MPPGRRGKVRPVPSRRVVIATPHNDHSALPRTVIIVIVVCCVIAAGVIGAVAASSVGGSQGSGSPPTSDGSSGSSTTPTSVGSTSPPPPLRVARITIPGGPSEVNGSAAISVRFNHPLAKSSPSPRLSPQTAGTWVRSGDTFRFKAKLPYLPLTHVTLAVAAGRSGPLAADGGRVGSRVVRHFETANGSVLRIDQLMSLLQYSPLAWKSSGHSIKRSDLAAEREALYRPPAGHFTWRRGGWPSELRALWIPGADGVMTRGLIMSFDADHGLPPDGAIDRYLWRALLVAWQTHAINTGGYNYALCSKSAPESLTVWHDGAVAVHVPANTGIASSPTPDGNFPVYTRLRSQVMRGTNPSGTKYADPVQYVAYFYQSDAVHYLARADYGIPQSLGCIELSLSDAARVWPYLAYGTIVSVVS